MTPSIDIVRCYVEHPDYFQGADPYTFVGMGDTALEALDDALETCAANGRDSAGADLPDDVDWPSIPQQAALLTDAHCDLGYAISRDPAYADKGDDYNTPSVYLLIKVTL